MHWERASPDRVDSEQMTSDKERSPLHRRRVLRLHERYRRLGLQFLPVDEYGFAPSVTRR